MISKVTGSTADEPSVSALVIVTLLASPGSHSSVQAGYVATAFAADERSELVDEHPCKDLEDLLALLRRRLGRRPTVGLRQSHLHELLLAVGDHRRKVHGHVWKLCHRCCIHELGMVGEHQRGLVATGVALPAAELLGEPDGALLAGQVKVGDGDSGAVRDRVDRS